MKTLVLAAGAAALALSAGPALAAKSPAKGATAMGPSQPIPYSQLDSYLKASPKQRASKDWWTGASTGTGTDTAATTASPSESPKSSPSPAAPPTENPAAANYQLPEITVAMVDRIPRRVTDAQGNAGDNTNFMVIGPEQKVLQTFEAAGWVQVDREKRDAVIHTIVATLTKQAYVELPMSELTLFGRVQDYGLAHAVPIQVVAQRHHLRLWKAPFQADGQEVWVGAATHE